MNERDIGDHLDPLYELGWTFYQQALDDLREERGSDEELRWWPVSQ